MCLVPCVLIGVDWHFLKFLLIDFKVKIWSWVSSFQGMSIRKYDLETSYPSYIWNLVFTIGKKRSILVAMSALFVAWTELYSSQKSWGRIFQWEPLTADAFRNCKLWRGLLLSSLKVMQWLSDEINYLSILWWNGGWIFFY